MATLEAKLETGYASRKSTKLILLWRWSSCAPSNLAGIRFHGKFVGTFSYRKTFIEIQFEVLQKMHIEALFAFNVVRVLFEWVFIIRGSSLPAPHPNFVRYVSLYATRMLTECLDNSIYNSVCYAVSNGTRISCLNIPKQIVRGATLLSLSYTHTSNINIKLKSIGERLCENSVEHINIYHQISIQT